MDTQAAAWMGSQGLTKAWLDHRGGLTKYSAWIIHAVLAGFRHAGVTSFLFELAMSCKVKLSGFIFRFLDCQEPEPNSEKWPDIRPESSAGYNQISSTSLAETLEVDKMQVLLSLVGWEIISLLWKQIMTMMTRAAADTRVPVGYPGNKLPG